MKDFKEYSQGFYLYFEWFKLMLKYWPISATIILIAIAIQAQAQPLSTSDWKQPLLNKSVKYVNYTSILDCSNKTPFYVFYDLYPSNFNKNTAHRKNKWPNYVPDRIRAVCRGYAVNKDYSNSGYDRGHLAPAANFKSSQYAENATFSFANAAPENSVLNRGVWGNIEEYERQLSSVHAGITVITGVIQSKNKHIGRNVGVPDYFYKILSWKENKKIKYEAFIAANQAYSKVSRINIKSLESMAGLDFGL